jgi:hypothetical protein
MELAVDLIQGKNALATEDSCHLRWQFLVKIEVYFFYKIILIFQ